MSEYMYSAWFRDEKFPVDDQDGEWVAMWIVIADTPEAALAWGDRIAKRHAASKGEPFLRSYLEQPSDYGGCDGFATTPRVRVGDDSVDPFVSNR